MKIGIDPGVIEGLGSTNENSEYYLDQIKREGHEIKILADSKESEGLDLHIDNKFGSWWEIYNHIRYEM